MASRTNTHVLKTSEDGVNWTLVWHAPFDRPPLSLQKWRVYGEGKTVKEKILAYASRLHQFERVEGENLEPVFISVPSKESVPSSSVTVMAGDNQETRGNSNLQCSDERGGASSSSASEFNYADGHTSGQDGGDSKGENVEEEDGSDDNVELAVKNAYAFRIFKPDDEEEREAVSILTLNFDCKHGHTSDVRLHMMGTCSNDSSGLFMRTIDSWTIFPEGERELKLYVRDLKGTWIKLCSPSKGYERSVCHANIIVNFLELAMNLKKIKPKTYFDQLMSKTGSTRVEIKAVLRKYYNSVIKKFVRLPRVAPSLCSAPIIKNMESLLKVKDQKEQNSSAAKIKVSSKETNNLALAMKSLNKRKRVVESDTENVSDFEDQKEASNRTIATARKRSRMVESDPENGSDLEDHVPLSRRNFHAQKFRVEKSVSRRERVRDGMNNDEPAGVDEGVSQDHVDASKADVSPSPAAREDSSPLRCRRENDLDYSREQFQDIAEIYGDENGGPGEILDDDNEELGNSAFCAICDDGGDLLFCDGPCMRSFHASNEAANASDSKCESLGYTVEKVKEMGSWLCPNCVESQHQCFICGKLGRSQGENKQVFVCDVALCGRFYHPLCLARWKKKYDKVNTIVNVDAFIKSIEEGVEEFCCPAHKCETCGKGEEEEGVDNSMRLAKCRRCPRAYHKAHLPKNISFKQRGHDPIRAWEIGDDDDPMKRLLIYCLSHEIIEDLCTPERDHLKGPGGRLLTKYLQSDELSRLVQKDVKVPKVGSSRHKTFEDDLQIIDKMPSAEKVLPKKRKQSSLKEETLHKNDTILGKLRAPPFMDSDCLTTAGKDRTIASVSKQVPKVTSLQPSMKHDPKQMKMEKRVVDEPATVKRRHICKEGQQRRILDIMRRASENVTLASVKGNLVQPSCYGENRKKSFIHRGELASILNAGKKAVEISKNGGNIEDAKRLCPRDRVLQVLKNEDSLRVYLAPFLHGMRYTSFGRHFTCVDKLQEIVERIHPYINDGDMVVDFCCGANDFSILLNQKLLSTGKTCHFRNFDIHPPKNGFCFTKGDWLQNEGRDFFEGKRLIIGLNPPFGVRAQLATRFVLKALQFRPKLLVLIVPPETMSSSERYKEHNYDLVWEDKELLKGRAFYLPGSVDTYDRENMAQWNVVTPPLFLWSTREMIKVHQEIAVQCNHIVSLQSDLPGLPHRTPTPSPPALETLKQKTFSDNLTNSGSTPTEGESSSHLQPSPATSSLADGVSQSSFDGTGSGHTAGSYLGQNQSTHHHQGCGDVFKNHQVATPKVFSGTAGFGKAVSTNHPSQQHTVGPKTSALEGVSGHLRHGKLSYVNPHPVKHVNELKHSSSDANQMQRRGMDHAGPPRHHNKDMLLRRPTQEIREQARPLGRSPLEQQVARPPLWYRNPQSTPAPQQWPLMHPYSVHPGPTYQLPPPPAPVPVPTPGLHGHYPGLTEVRAQLQGSFHNNVRLPEERFLRGQTHAYNRRFGTSQRDTENGTGGWLE